MKTISLRTLYRVPLLQRSRWDLWILFPKQHLVRIIFIIIVSPVTILANSFILVTFFVDPLRIIRDPTTNFIIGLAIVYPLTALIQEPIYATCFMLFVLSASFEEKLCSSDGICRLFFGISSLNIAMHRFCFHINAVYRGGIASEVRPHDYKVENLH